MTTIPFKRYRISEILKKMEKVEQELNDIVFYWARKVERRPKKEEAEALAGFIIMLQGKLVNLQDILNFVSYLFVESENENE